MTRSARASLTVTAGDEYNAQTLASTEPVQEEMLTFVCHPVSLSLILLLFFKN